MTKTIRDEDFQAWTDGLMCPAEIGWTDGQIAEAKRRERQMTAAEGDRLTNVQIASLCAHGEWRRAHPILNEDADTDDELAA